MSRRALLVLPGAIPGVQALMAEAGAEAASILAVKRALLGAALTGIGWT
jgi:hypothetical protein